MPHDSKAPETARKVCCGCCKNCGSADCDAVEGCCDPKSCNPTAKCGPRCCCQPDSDTRCESLMKIKQADQIAKRACIAVGDVVTVEY